MKKIGKILLRLLVVYLIISAFYIMFHIDFGEPPEIVGMGFSPAYNRMRIFMGLPPTGTTYNGVSPTYFIHAAIRLILAVVIQLTINRGKLLSSSTMDKIKTFIKEHKVFARVLAIIFAAILGIVIGIMMAIC